jgi:hypothetical protein
VDTGVDKAVGTLQIDFMKKGCRVRRWAKLDVRVRCLAVSDARDNLFFLFRY